MAPTLLNIHHLGNPQALLEDQTVRVSQENGKSIFFLNLLLHNLLYPVGFFRLNGARYLSGLIVIYNNIVNHEAWVTSHHSLSTR